MILSELFHLEVCAAWEPVGSSSSGDSSAVEFAPSQTTGDRDGFYRLLGQGRSQVTN